MLGLPASSIAANIALNKPAFASVVNDTAINVTDNNFGTEWNTNGDGAAPNHFVGIDLGAEVKPSFARVFWNVNQPRGFTIEVATTVDLTDPTSFTYGTGDWQTAYSRDSLSDQPGSPDMITLTLPAAPSGHTGFRYIRIQGSEGPADDNPQWGVLEFQVLDAPLPNLTGVTKTAGGPVANAIVQVTGPAPVAGSAPSFSRSALSDATGHFTIVGLDPGQYAIRGLAPGQYAPVSATVNVAAVNVTQDITFTTVAHNSTAALPAYGLDFVASDAKPGDQNAQTSGDALPVDELPAGNQVWLTSSDLPLPATRGENLPPTLKFFFPPTADGQNNVINAANTVLPLPAAHYTAVYVLQVAGDQPAYVNATLNYTDGTSAPVLTGSGDTNYAFNLGTGDAGEDEIVAFTVSRLINTVGTNLNPFNVFMRAIPVDSSKVLKNITFGDYIAGPGAGTFSRGFILSYSADSTDTPAALGSIAGHVKFGATAVPNALVTWNGYRANTDAAGAYKFNSVPAGTYPVSARKPANYPLTTINVVVAAGQNVTNADITFANPVPVVTEFLSNPNIDEVSSDANILDATLTNFAFGREYIPTGLYSPATVPDPPVDPAYNTPPWQASTATGVPGALQFQFGDIQDTPITVGTPGYPEGGTPSSVVLHGATFIAPIGANISNAYFLVVGLEGSTQVAPIIRYVDGTTEQKILNVSDWFGTNTADELPYVVMHGRHDIGAGAEANRGSANIKINALVLPVDVTKAVKEVFFPEGVEPNKFPVVLAVAWEVDHMPPAASDVQVVVKKADNTPAERAIVTAGPYGTRTDANGVATFRAIPSGATLDISAYLSGSTKAATRAAYVVPTGQKLPTPAVVNLTLPAAAPIFVQLGPAFDYDVISTLDMPGDYKGAPGNDRAFKAEDLAATGSNVVVNGVPYIMPHKELGFNNVMRLNGQTIKVAPGHYSSVNIVTTGMGTGATRLFYATLKYDDGSTREVQYGSVDWVQDWTHPENSNRRLFFRQVAPANGPTPGFISMGRRSGDNDDTLQIAFVPQMIPVNATKTLVSVTFPPIYRDVTDDDCSVIAMTLEANDTTATGTITGKVVGKPAGAAASGPIEMALVSWDPGHAVYTDASGNFTLNNVPLGAGTLTVVPQGSGILTKTFPVTVTAATSAGTLDVGAAAAKVSVTLAQTNSGSGLKQVEGYPTVFTKDSSRAEFKYTRPETGTRVVNIAGKTGRELSNGSGVMYFQVDKGWLNRGRMGSIGLDTSTFSVGANTTFVGKVAPQLYMQVTYLDRGTDAWRLNFNRMEGWTWDAAPNTPSMRETFRNYTPREWTGTAAQDISVKKTDTNTWKSVVFNLNPTPDANGIQNAFGAYMGLPLEADFSIVGDNGAAEVISEVIISTSPDFSVPAGPYTVALRIAAGLQTATTADMTALDVTGPAGTKDNVITILDALKLLHP
jgi:hypothetical protein